MPLRTLRLSLPLVVAVVSAGCGMCNHVAPPWAGLESRARETPQERQQRMEENRRAIEEAETHRGPPRSPMSFEPPR
jgi:hypothetical protein